MESAHRHGRSRASFTLARVEANFPWWARELALDEESKLGEHAFAGGARASSLTALITASAPSVRPLSHTSAVASHTRQCQRHERIADSLGDIAALLSRELRRDRLSGDIHCDGQAAEEATQLRPITRRPGEIDCVSPVRCRYLGGVVRSRTAGAQA